MTKYKGLYIEHKIKDAKSKDVAQDNMYGWKEAELTSEEWLQKLDAGQAIQLSEFEITSEGIFRHKKEFWKYTHFFFADADNIKGVEFDKEGRDKNPKGLEPWTEKDGLSKRFPDLKNKVYAVGESVSSMSDDKKPHHRRYRLVFQFDEPITSELEFHQVILKLAEEFPIIPPVTRSPAQPVFGNARDGFNFHICGNILPLSEYTEPEPEPPPKKSQQATRQPTERKEGLDEFLRRHGVAYTHADKPNKFYVECPYGDKHASGKNKPKDAYVFDDGTAWGFYCSHTTCDMNGNRTWDAFKRGYGIETKTYQVDGGYVATNLPLLEPELENPYPVFPNEVFVGGFEPLLKAFKKSRICSSFIFALGITAVSVTVGRKAFFSTEPDLQAVSEDWANTYSLIIGPTTTAGKSEARDTLSKILRTVHEADAVFTPYRYINTISSREGLAVDMRTDTDDFTYEDGMFREGIRALLSLDEAKHLLDNSRREVTRNITADINELWKCPPDNNVRTKHDGVIVDYPVLSIFGCSTQDWLEGSVMGSDIDGGFINRFMPFLNQAMPYVKRPEIDIDAYTSFIFKLRQLLPEPEAVRAFHFTDEAYELYHEWAEKLYNHAVANPKDAAMTARAADHARRIGLCMAIMTNDSNNNTVDIDILNASIKTAEYLSDVARYVFKNVTASKEAQVERKILTYLAELGNEAKVSEVLQKFASRERPVARLFHQLVDGLVFSGRIEVMETRPKTIRRVG